MSNDCKKEFLNISEKEVVIRMASGNKYVGVIVGSGVFSSYEYIVLETSRGDEGKRIIFLNRVEAIFIR